MNQILPQINDLLCEVMLNSHIFYGYLTSLTTMWALFLLLDVFRIHRHATSNDRSIRLSDKYINIVLLGGLLIKMIFFGWIFHTQDKSVTELALFFDFWFAISLTRITEIIYKTFLVINPTSKDIEENHKIIHIFLP